MRSYSSEDESEDEMYGSGYQLKTPMSRRIAEYNRRQSRKMSKTITKRKSKSKPKRMSRKMSKKIVPYKKKSSRRMPPLRFRSKKKSVRRTKRKSARRNSRGGTVIGGRRNSRGGTVIGGGRNDWINYVLNFQKKHGVSYKDALQMASKARKGISRIRSLSRNLSGRGKMY